MQRWICTVCRYVYDPSRGEDRNEVPPLVVFDDLTEEWLCPVCKAGKGFFVPL